ncbi:hypothetical protein, conserved [Angomonas deanei]|uniref:Sel1 repeat n=1 Tax=Angomonas deanei TaxID=59799 RepID=A0A7G2CQE9_9TRYP|nr:hypothetical protein, conserved [Angomonas deanei]
MCHCLFKACGEAKLEDSVAILKSYLAEQQLSVDKCAAVVVLLEAVLSLQFQLNSQYRPTKEELSSMDALVTHGHPGGMLLVSNLLRDGVGVEKNAAASLDWLRKSAELRYVPALHELADLHEKGCSDGATSIEADWGEAVHLYKIAASAGYAASQLNLGKLWLEASQEAAANHLCSTEEVEDMMKSARQWLSEAAKNGSSEAKSLRERL